MKFSRASSILSNDPTKSKMKDLVRFTRDSVLTNEDITENRRKDGDLVFFKYKYWYEITNRSNYIDESLYMNDLGIFTSKKKIEESALVIPDGYNIIWNNIDKCWYVKNILESNKADSLLSLIRGLDVKTDDDIVTKMLIEAESLNNTKTIKLLENIISNIVYSSSRDSCIENGVSYNKERYEELLNIKEELDLVVNKLKKVL